MISIESGKPRLDDAVAVAVAGFVKKYSLELRTDVDTHLAMGQLVYRITNANTTAGFALFNKWEDVLYLSGIILIPEIQGKGIAPLVVARARSETRAKFFSLRTQSAIMWRTGEKICKGNWLPAPSKLHDPAIYAAGVLTAEKIGGTFPLSPKCYAGPLYGAKPIYPNRDIQLWWDSLCTFERGDAVICSGKFCG